MQKPLFTRAAEFDASVKEFVSLIYPKLHNLNAPTVGSDML